MRILIFDDHEAIQFFVKLQIENIVPTAEILRCSNVESARSVIKKPPGIDFAICDLEINSGSNLSIPEMCFERNIAYMVYSSHVNKVLISELININVNSYVSKTSGIDSLKRGIEMLLQRQKFYCHLVMSTIESKEEFKQTERLFLSDGQKAVIEVMSKGHNRVETAKILKIKKSTINNHIARAREINECKNFEELLRRYRFWDNF
jgi:two-component system nitrate/nitrite response regulator NarL